ncbi:MAG TPA: hypothetical protein VGH81_08485 [Rudaea sp.]
MPADPEQGLDGLREIVAIGIDGLRAAVAAAFPARFDDTRK